MKLFYVTFGQRFRNCDHPTFPEANPDGWVEIEAEDGASAGDLAFRYFGTEWSALYHADNPNWRPEMFPLGCLGRVDSEGRIS